MELDQDCEDIKDFLVLQSKTVQTNASVVSPDMMGVEHALHIDKKTPPKFVPRMPKSAADSENDSCARVTVAGSLLGCYIGYFRGEDDLIDGSRRKEDKSDQFLGGYLISKLAFKHALKPNPKLVFDADRTEELWLVSYNAESVEYVPVVIGKLFVNELVYTPVSGKHPDLKIKMCIENNDTAGLWLDRKNKLDVGYYEISVCWPDVHSRTIYNAYTEIVQIDKELYEEKKRLVANFLSRHSDTLPNKPQYLSW